MPMIQSPESAVKSIASELNDKFRECFGSRANLYRAPGRVNLIGEHTDYNDGFVMPSAIEYYVWVAIAPRPDRRLVVHSLNFGKKAEIDLEDRAPQPRKDWSDYVQGVALMLGRSGKHLKGANLIIRGDVPIGSGLSSSAAIEVSTGFALLKNSGIEVERVDLARLAQRAENEFVGARCGIMDQFVSCNGSAGHALMLDCRSLEYKLLPVPSRVSLVICNTMVKHELASGEYNTRRSECEQGVRLLARSLPKICALRDVSLEELKAHRQELPETVYRRCLHVVSENARVTDAAAALDRGDLEEFGKLMADSHRSLRDDYKVSCDELDLMVELAGKQKGVFGARMTGGGFGGCTINLVKVEAVDEFRRNVADSYEKATGLRPQLFVSPAADGAAEIKE